MKSIGQLRFSLAALFLLVAICGVAFAVYRYLNPPPVYPLPFWGTEIDGPPNWFYSFGKDYVTDFSDEEIVAAPCWDRQSTNPPISAEDAMVRADIVRKRLFAEKKFEADGDGNWQLVGAELRPYDVNRGLWSWLVRYAYNTTQSGPLNELLLTVLMDGRVIEPRIRTDD